MKRFKSTLGVSAFVLLVSGLLCKGLGALFRLPLTNLLGIEGIGVFQLTMSLYAFALVLTCGGVTTAMAKLISATRARGEETKIGTYLKRAMLLSMSFAVAIGILFLLLARVISSIQGIDAERIYWLFIVLLPLGAGLATLRGFFQGYENMFPTAVSQVIEQVFKFVFGLSLAFLFGRFGMAQGVFGAFVGIILSQLIALFYVVVLFFVKHKHMPKETELSRLKIARAEFDRANFPLALSASIMPLVGAFDGLIVVPRLLVAGFSQKMATQLFGLQSGVVGAILNFPLIISMAVTTTLLPNISYLISRGTGGRHTIEKGLKILLFLILPTTFGVVAISRQVLPLFYNDMSTAMLNTTFNLMLYGGFSIIFTALLQYFNMLLQANGQFRYILVITAIGGAGKALISFFFTSIPQVNIYSLVLGNIVLGAIICVLAVWKLKRIAAFSISFTDLSILIFSTFAMFLTAYTFINCNYFSNILNILLAIILGALVYFVLTIPVTIKIMPGRKRYV